MVLRVTTLTPMPGATPSCKNLLPVTDAETGLITFEFSPAHDADCEAWAASGECDANPDYMHLHCPASCGTCGGTSECANLVDVTTYETSVDHDANCRIWAATGECDANPDYMHLHCASACLTCDTLFARVGPAEAMAPAEATAERAEPVPLPEPEAEAPAEASAEAPAEATAERAEPVPLPEPEEEAPAEAPPPAPAPPTPAPAPAPAEDGGGTLEATGSAVEGVAVAAGERAAERGVGERAAADWHAVARVGAASLAVAALLVVAW